MLGLCGLLCVGILAVGMLASAAVARHRAQSAADLAALAAADVALGLRAGEPCRLAAEVAGANSARLTACVLHDDGSVQVVVQVSPAGWSAALGDAAAQARAGQAP